MTLTSEERYRLAHTSETQACRAFFAAQGTPITQAQAQRISFISYLVFQRRLSDYPDWEQRPRRFVSRDPRRGEWVS